MGTTNTAPAVVSPLRTAAGTTRVSAGRNPGIRSVECRWRSLMPDGVSSRTVVLTSIDIDLRHTMRSDPVRPLTIALTGGAVGVLLAAAGGVAIATTANGHADKANTKPSVGVPAAKAADSDWTTYHRDNTRAGVAVGLSPVGTPAKAWQAKLDGAVDGHPLVVGQHVYAATENDTVYELDIATGKVLWQTHAGTPVPLSNLPCGNIDPLGITSTMVFDEATGLLF